MPETSPVHEDVSDILSKSEDGRFSDPIEARKKAMDYLARREHSRKELCRKMKSAGFDANVALDAIEELRKDGLQSDRRFVESFVQSRISHGKGPRLIRADLSQRGVRDPMIHEVLGEVEQDWGALARETRAKKFGEEQPHEFEEKARQMRFLQSRGFEPDQIQAAVADKDD
ncbi:MAG: recombination regulator RecX [Gammaproteobacteria bacterium]|nr:recombination regulator RecX [Gammaproteobacteria bacterium]